MPKKSIETLNEDLKKLLLGIQKGEGHQATQESLSALGVASALSVHRQLNKEPKVRPPNTIYASEIGIKCPRKIWYKHNLDPSEQQKHSIYPPNVITKFMVGDLIEQLAMVLVEAAGHKVTHKQEPVSTNVLGWEIRGKIDCIVDGNALVDVKSTTTFGMLDFKKGEGGNKFGYREQLAVYNNILVEKGIAPIDTAGFLAVDKSLGHMHYAPQTWGMYPDNSFIKLLVKSHIDPISRPLDTLGRYASVATTPDGCFKLCTECSYCDYKKECWKDANYGEGIRSFLYSGGKVVDLVVIGNKAPKVPEITNSVDLEDFE